MPTAPVTSTGATPEMRAYHYLCALVALILLLNESTVVTQQLIPTLYMTLFESIHAFTRFTGLTVYGGGGGQCLDAVI